MKISIITVAYNSGSTIGDTLRSVATQTYSNIEHIVIDGGSTDNTLQVVHQCGQHVSSVVSEKDRGIYDAMNKGLALASGDVVGLLNSDDLYAHSAVLAEVASTFSKNNQLQTCYGDLVYVDAFDTSRVVRYWRSGEYKPGAFRTGWAPPHPAFFVRRLAYQQHGMFDLDFRLAADFELMLRFLEVHHLPTCHIPDVMVRMRLGGATNRSFGNVVKQNQEIQRAFKRNGLSTPNPFFYLGAKSIRRLGQYLMRPRLHMP